MDAYGWNPEELSFDDRPPLVMYDFQLAYGSPDGVDVRGFFRTFSTSDEACHLTACMHFRALLDLNGIDWRNSKQPWGDRPGSVQVEPPEPA